MQLLAIVALIWQRRRVAAAAQRAWRWATSTTAAAPDTSRRGRAAHLGAAALGRGWRAVDTAPNAARIARLVRWMRGVAGGAEASRSTYPGRAGSVRHG